MMRIMKGRSEARERGKEARIVKGRSEGGVKDRKDAERKERGSGEGGMMR